MITTWKIFTAQEAKDWGWSPQDGDQFYNEHTGEWEQIPIDHDPVFEVEPLNRRPVEMLETDQLVQIQNLRLEVSRLGLDIEAIKTHLHEYHGAAL